MMMQIISKDDEIYPDFRVDAQILTIIVTTMLPLCPDKNRRMEMLVKTSCELKVLNQSFFLVQSQVPEPKVKLFLEVSKIT